MKIVKFNLAECEKDDAREFLYQILNAAKGAGFIMPDVAELEWKNVPFPKHHIFDALADLLQQLEALSGLNYVLKVYGTEAMIMDEDPANAKKEKALRRSKRKAWKLS